MDLYVSLDVFIDTLDLYLGTCCSVSFYMFHHIHLRVHAFGIDFYQSVAKGFFVFAVTSFLLSIAI